MNKLNNKQVIGNIIIVTLIGLIIAVGYFTFRKKISTSPLQVSVIMRDYSDEYGQSSLKQGIDEGTNNFNVEVSMISMEPSADVEEVIDIIHQEIKNGSDHLIIEPLDDEKLLAYLVKVKDEIGITFINTSIGNQQTFSVISAPQEELTELLIKDIEAQISHAKQNILILTPEKTYQDILISQILLEKDLKAAGHDVTIKKVKEQNLEQEYRIKRELSYQEYQTVILMDKTLLEAASKLNRASTNYTEIKFFGYGKSSSIIRGVETNSIASIAVIDDFSVGYLAIQQAVNQEQKQPVIDYDVINKETIFEKENQKFLFPIFY